MIIYLDMDGVIADFFTGLAKTNGKTHWKEIEDIELSIEEIANTDFFNTLALYPTSQKLVDFVKKVANETSIDWGICSSPLRGDWKNSAFWKTEWLKKHDFLPKNENLKFSVISLFMPQIKMAYQMFLSMISLKMLKNGLRKAASVYDIKQMKINWKI